MGALFRHVRRREIGDDALAGQRKAKAREGASYPLTALGHGLVGEANDDESVLSRRQLDLDVDPSRLHPLERHRDDSGRHAPALRMINLSTTCSIACGKEQERKTNVSGKSESWEKLPTDSANVLDAIPKYSGGVDAAEAQQLLGARGRRYVDFRQVLANDVDADKDQSTAL